ncbi:MAG: DUF1302 family protein [Candidatus Binataceae bacterium]
MIKRSRKWFAWRKPLALSASVVGAAAVVALIGLSAGVSYAQDAGAGGTQSSEPAFIKNLHITGFFQNTSATWINSSAQEYNTYGPESNKTLNRNSLAAERNMIQVDVNDDFTENDSMFMRLWGVYEPAYPWETGCLDKTGGLDGQKVDCTADFYNQYGIRELWFKHRWGPLQFFVGKQIVTWGESLAFRVGDQINTQDVSWAFGFSNLEQSRVPLWMIHPILNLPSAGPFSSNFAELIYIPGFDFMYTQVDQPNDSFDGLDNIRGRININAETPGGRYAGRSDTRADLSGNEAPPFLILQGAAPGSPGPGFFIGINNTVQKIPSATWGNSQIGFRLHTLVENSEVTMFYLWNHDYNPVAQIDNRVIIPLGGGTFLRQVNLIEPQYQAFGITANRPLYLPGVLAQLPFVIRAESLYKNHEFFNTLAVPGTIYDPTGINGSPSSLTNSDEVLWLLALDLDQAYTPWLTSTGNLTANLELNGTTILSYSHKMQGAAGYFERAYHNDINILASVGTSWWWGAVSPNWTTIFNPNGETFLSFPSVQLTPPWTNKYFMKLEYVDVEGTNKYGLDGGVFKGKDLLFAQFQYNFSLM